MVGKAKKKEEGRRMKNKGNGGRENRNGKYEFVEERTRREGGRRGNNMEDEKRMGSKKGLC